MKGVLIFAVLLTGVLKCTQPGSGEPEPSCNTKATVVDLTGLDGCGLMLELEDGTRLNPERRTYIQAPSAQEDPLYYTTLTAGDHLLIAYRETSNPNVCMSGKTVFITCITKLQ